MILRALPPWLFEIIYCAIGATCWVTLAICVRFLATVYVQFRREAVLHRLEIIVVGLRTMRLPVGFTIFMTGLTPLMTWEWLARYLANTRHDVRWMGEMPWMALPIVAGMIAIIGLACIVRALVPTAWGRFGYWGAISTALAAVAITQVIR